MARKIILKKNAKNGAKTENLPKCFLKNLKIKIKNFRKK